MLKRLVLTVALLGWLATPVLHAADGHSDHAAGAAAAATGDAKAHDAHDAHGDHKAYPLLPDPFNRADQLQALWVLIIFVVLLMLLCWKVWPNILAGLKKREQGIRDDIADAEAARKKAEATLAEYNQKLATAEGQMRDILSKAAADAEKLATQMKMTAQQEAEEIKERATRDIEAARKAAVADIYAQAAELSTGIASKILKRNLNADDQRELVASSIQQFSTTGKVQAMARSQQTHASPAAVAYAQSVLDLANEQKQAEPVGQELAALAQIGAENPSFREILINPAISTAERQQLLDKTFRGKVSPLVFNTLGVLNEKKRLGLLGQIAQAYSDLLDVQLGKVEVDLTVAQKLSPEQLEQARQTIGKKLGREPVIRLHVDESLLGGMVVRVGDKLIDASVRYQLQAMKEQMLAAAPK